VSGESAAFTRGCREKPFAKTRSTLVDVHLSAAVHDAFATDRLGATDEMAVFGTHPYRRSSGLARGFPDSHTRKEQWVSSGRPGRRRRRPDREMIRGERESSRHPDVRVSADAS
jgi:hypothetical protein